MPKDKTGSIYENNLLHLPSDEMAFRQIYKDLLVSRKLTTIFRPGLRGCKDFRGYCEGNIVIAKILKDVGADWAKIPPIFIDGVSFKIKIDNIEAILIRELDSQHFIGTSPDIWDRLSLIYHLGVIYNRPIEDFIDDAEVTRITFSYID